jgi:asparagine synthase (glutamine-hydrolysing)
VRAVRGGGPFGLTAIGSCWATDGELRQVLRAAEAGVLSDLSVLYGAYVTVVNGHRGGDRGERPETIVFGDPAGLARVFFVELDGGVVWATDAQQLGALVGARPQPNVLALDMAVDGIAAWGGSVPLDKVRAVPPRSLLRIGRSGPTIERWHFPPAPATFEERAARFGSVLSEGVRRRCERFPRVGSALGGTDSSTLTALAAISSQALGRGAGSVIAVTHVGDDATADLQIARAIASSCQPTLRHEEIGLDERAFRYRGLDHVGDLPHVDLPSSVSGIWAARADLARAAEGGAGCYLAGYGGDTLLSASSLAWADLALRGSRSQLLRQASDLARASRSPLLVTAAGVMRLRGTTYARSLRQAAHAIRTGALDGPDAAAVRLFRWVTPTHAADWLTDPAADWIANELDQLTLAGCEDDDPVAAVDWWRLEGEVLRAAALRSLAADLGMELELPYFDGPLLDVWAALGNRREPPGTFKPLVTRGFAGTLPAAITSRTRKDDLGVESADAQGMSRHIETLWSIVEGSALIAAGAFDRAAVIEECQRVFARVERRTAPLLALLSVESWLANTKQNLTLSTWWEFEPEEDQ